MGNEVKDYANVRGAVDVLCEGWRVPKTFVMRGFAGCASVSEAVRDATQMYLKLYKDYPRYAFLKTLPKNVENGVEVDSVMLFEAEWMAAQCVAVGWVPEQ